MELFWEVGVQRGDTVSVNQGAKLSFLSPPFCLQDAPGSEGVSGAAGHGERDGCVPRRGCEGEQPHHQE